MNSTIHMAGAARKTRNRRAFFEGALTAMMLGLLCAAFTFLIFRAILKTEEFNDNIRIGRCARYGENIPPHIVAYCDGLGF